MPIWYEAAYTESCDTNIKLHSIDLRGRHDLDWSDVHKEYREKWNYRRDHVVSNELLSEDISATLICYGIIL